jgi:hypothetical protein
VILNYLVKPLYEKLSQIPKNRSNVVNGIGGNTQPQQQQQQCFKKPFTFSIRKKRGDDDHAAAATSAAAAEVVGGKYAHSNSSGNLWFPRQKRCAASCPSSMRSSPSHSGLLTFGGAGFPDVPVVAVASGSLTVGPVSLSTASSMEELHSAIEGAIAHCKNTMVGAMPGYLRKAAADGDEICAF